MNPIFMFDSSPRTRTLLPLCRNYRFGAIRVERFVRILVSMADGAFSKRVVLAIAHRILAAASRPNSAGNGTIESATAPVSRCARDSKQD